MAQYVLGEEGARKFRRLTQQDLTSGNSQRYGKSPALDNAFPHPYEVRWSNSLISTDGIPGGYMIWLPDNCLYVDLSCIKPENFPQISSEEITAIQNADKWYELTPGALSTSSPWPASFDIWLNDYLSAPTFSTKQNNESDVEPIHIVHIDNYRPCPSIKSSIIVGSGKKLLPDEKSIALSSDVGDLSSHLSSDWNDKLRIKGFHTFGDSTAYDNTTSFIVRGGGGGIANPPSGNEYVDYLNVANFKNDILQDVADALSNDTSALTVDEQSVSKGGDGWGISSESGVEPALHMWHFHDHGADVENPEMCDFVLRYYPEPESDQSWLRYISWDKVKELLSSEGGGGGEGGGGEVTPDQLSSIPCWGMFMWTEKTRTIGPGGVMIGRQWVNASGTGSDKSDALYQVKCTINANGSYSCQVVSGVSLGQAPTTTDCWIPIYQISGGKIAADYRGAFVVPAFD